MDDERPRPVKCVASMEGRASSPVHAGLGSGDLGRLPSRVVILGLEILSEAKNLLLSVPPRHQGAPSLSRILRQGGIPPNLSLERLLFRLGLVLLREAKNLLSLALPQHK